MRLIIGPAGSGKTSYILNCFRDSLRIHDFAVRLLVPTATMAQHLQNLMAREGFVFPRRLIQTLSGFVDTWATGVRQVPDTVLYLIVEEAVKRVDHAEFKRVAHMRGFCASLAHTINEFASAGCDSARLAVNLPDSPLAAAFLAVYREVDSELRRRGLVLRSQRLEHAAARLEAEGASGVRTIWLDGFHALPDPELRVLMALAAHADVTLTLAESDATEDLHRSLLSAGAVEKRFPASRPAPALALARAPGIEREAEEIARRILEQAANGRGFREMGIVVRTAETYVPVLRSTLARFGIPAHFYFDSNLEEHAAIRFLSGAVDAMLGGWDHTATLAVLRLAPRFTDSPAMDRFDFRVREQMPGAGLGGLKSLLAGEDGHAVSSGDERLIRLIDHLDSLEEWRLFSLIPKDWAARFRTLRNLYRAARPPEGEYHELALMRRSQAAVLNLFDEALEEAALALPPDGAVGIAEFWRAVKSVLRLKPLRLEDGRRNVVHVLSAPEARQWVLSVVFVCGLVERQFPRLHHQDPFFPDAARRQLNAAGIRVRTAADWEREERALFDSAATRGTDLVVFSYPEFDARGERHLPSLFLEGLGCEPVDSRLVRPRPRSVPAPRGTAAIRAPELLEVLRARTRKLSPTALESYLQCPFQFFGNRILRLEPPPPRPEKRFDNLAQGTVVHAVLALWYAQRGEIGLLFDGVFAEYCEENHIPGGYRTERSRHAILEDLERFVQDKRWPRDGFESTLEDLFVFPLDESLDISGKMDRLDVAGERAFVIDYKYSRAQVTRGKLANQNLLQAPLYLMAAEKYYQKQPAAMFYVGLKGEVKYAGWSDGPAPLQGEPFPENWLQLTRERTLAVVAEIRSGRVEPSPADLKLCRWCDCHDVCRVAAREEEAMAEEA